MNWPEVSIDKICQPTGQRDPKETPNEEFSYVDISSIDRDQKTIRETTLILGSEAPSRARKEIKADDILISTVRPNLNAVAIVPDELNRQVASTGFCVIRPNQKLLNNKYFFYFTQSAKFIDSISSKVRGAHYPAVSDSDIKKYKIPLPPISEQHRIVEILDQADALKKKRAEADEKAARILPALFYKMFGDPATNPKGWEMHRLENIIDIGTQLVDPNIPEFENVPHVGGEDIEKDTGIVKTPRLVCDSNLRSSKFHFSSKHVLYSKIRPYLNKVAFPKYEGVCSADIYPLAPKDDRTSPWFIVALLRSQAFLSYVKKYSERLRIPKLNKEQLGAFEIILPNKKLVCDFENKAEELSILENSRKKCSEEIETLFETLLYEGFEGKLTSKWRKSHVKKLLSEMEEQVKALKHEDIKNEN